MGIRDRARLAHTLRQRDAAVGETQARQRVWCDHVDTLGDLETGRVRIHDKGGDTAVSYTHLDVYKRQGQSRGPTGC